MDDRAFVDLLSDIGELERAGHTAWNALVQASLYPRKIHIV